MNKALFICGLLAASGLALAEPSPVTVALELVVRDSALAPAANMAISGVLNQTVIEKKNFFSSTRRDSEIPFSCVTNQEGICALSAPLKAPRSYAHGSDSISGEIRATGTQADTSAAPMRVVLERPVAYDERRETHRIYLTRSPSGVVVSPLARILTPAQSAALIKIENFDTGTFVSAFAQRIDYRRNAEDASSYLQCLIDNATGTPAYRITSAIFLTRLPLADTLGSAFGALAAGERKRVATVAGPSGQVSFPLDRLDLDGEADKNNLVEHVTFSVPEAFLANLVANHVSGTDDVLEFSVPGERGQQIPQAIPHFVIAGMLMRVAEWRAQHPFH